MMIQSPGRHPKASMEVLNKDSGFDSMGELLEILFYNLNRTSGESNLRETFYVKVRFPQGQMGILVVFEGNETGNDKGC